LVAARRIRTASRKSPTGYHSAKFDVVAEMIPTYQLHGTEAIPIDVIVGQDRRRSSSQREGVSEATSAVRRDGS
jgi:hypothetical protein